jgi:hypothetical protein
MADRAIAVLIKDGEPPKNISVDAREKSPYTHDSLGGRPTFLGAWEPDDGSGHIYMMGLAQPDPNSAVVDESWLPQTRREPGPLKGPLLFTKLDDTYTPIDFTVEDLSSLTSAETGPTSS